MSIDIPRLSKTLNDETRIRILRLLKEKQSRSYSDLMETLGITNTGRLNYHLKVLRDLITKDGLSGAYSLSEKGIVAIDFLDKFQTMTSGITAGVSVAPVPYESTARALRALLGLELVAILLIGVYSYLTLPAQVPLHYTLNGQLQGSAPKGILIVIAVLLNIPQGVFLILSRARYSLVNRYPFAVRIPRLASNLSQMDYERRGYWINRLFAALLAFAVVVGGTMAYLMTGIYVSATSGTSLSIYSVELTLLVVGIAVIGLLYYLQSYSRQMRAEAGKLADLAASDSGRMNRRP
jgi:DNA-binding transcriptional ArsR family regulator